MKTLLRIFLGILFVLYPVLIFFLLVVAKIPMRTFSLCVIAFALLFFLVMTGKNRSSGSQSGTSVQKKNLPWRQLVSVSFLFIFALICVITNKDIFLKLYPITVSAMLLFVFGSTLFWMKPNMILRFASMADKTIIGGPYEKRVTEYCRKVTVIWCVFFILNGCAAAYTTFCCSTEVWSLYNGGISYILMGVLFTGEFIVRKLVQRTMKPVHYLTDFTADSRKDDTIMCYEDSWSKGICKTWKDFLTDTAKMRQIINSKNAQDFILHCEDYWYFLVTFAALLQCKKDILLTANISPAFIDEIRKPGTEFLTDQNISDTMHIPSLLENAEPPSQKDIRTCPKIDSDETRIHMYTSGSTGKPKAVLQRMTEFQQDNAFIISKWGEEFTKRKLVATVSQHHIYGFLFTISLPFALAVPFRRKRIEFPEEFETFTDESYIIIAVPAFLKRTVEVEDKLSLANPWIFTSGGVLLPEVAEKTNEVFGFWPMEVYGSTETSGIAYRQSFNGLEWTPFDNAKIWKNEDGCLVIISPYIKDPAGFTTGDLVEIHGDGKFLLKGRADSIVKVEEKRISVTEVENRITQTGLVSDVCVVPMSGRRQYLAAAIAFNEEGKKKFAGWDKIDINKFFHNYLVNYFENVVLPKKWRYLEKLPMDVQCKHKKLDIQALFTDEPMEKK
jgi:uncharacterized membrane protein/acyl-CoA synthetase (AMP-forming)/AMP-acid ligase II